VKGEQDWIGKSTLEPNEGILKDYARSGGVVAGPLEREDREFKKPV